MGLTHLSLGELWRVTGVPCLVLLTLPFWGLRSPMKWRASVDLTLPFLPIIPINSPFVSSNSRPQVQESHQDNYNLFSQVWSCLIKFYSPLFKFSWILQDLTQIKISVSTPRCKPWSMFVLSSGYKWIIPTQIFSFAHMILFLPVFPNFRHSVKLHHKLCHSSSSNVLSISILSS